MQGGHLGLQGLAGQRAERRMARERVEGGLQAQQQPDRPGGHLGPDGQPVGRSLLNLCEEVAPRLGPLVALGQRDGQRATRELHQVPDHGELGVGVGPEVRDQLDHPVAGVGHPQRDRLELVGPRPQGRRRVARGGAVVQRARRREPDRPRAQGLGGQRAHGGGVLLRRVLQAGAPLAHDEEPQCPVGELGAQVDVVRPAPRPRRGTPRRSPRSSRSPRRARRRGCPRRPP